MIYIGTSGFSYKEWKGIFYPEKLSPNKYLSFYANHFRTTEINNTFYRIPSAKTSLGWARQVPDHFRFALKLNRRITHQKRLLAVEDEMGWFLNGVEPMGEKLGFVLVQLPPWFRLNLEALEDFLSKYARRVPLALEFRHESWSVPETFALLRSFEASWGVVETDKQAATRETTSPFCYVRLRRSGYTAQEMQSWAEWIGGQAGDLFVYFKHAEQAPALARQLLDAVGNQR